jgi:CHAD domain-containing protein
VSTEKTSNRSVPHSNSVPLKDALRRLQRRLEIKLATLKRSVTPDTVHEARTAARRLRALLHGFRVQLSPSSAHRYHYWLKRVTRELGTLRDADVARQNIAELVKSARGRHRHALDTLSFGFHQRRQRLAGKLRAEMARSAWSVDVRELKTAAADPGLILPNGPPIAAVTMSLLAHRRRRLRARLRNATRSKHALHRLRTKVKRLRYVLEESSRFGAGLGSAREVRLLKRLQDSLGQLHDLVVLKDLSKDGAASRAARKILRKKCDARWNQLLADYDESRVALLHLWDTVDRPSLQSRNRSGVDARPKSVK